MLTHTIYCPKCISTSITYFQKKIIKYVQTQIYFSKMYEHMQHILFTNNSSNIINHTWFLQNVEAHGSQFDLHTLEDDLKAMEDYLFPWKMTSPSISKSKLLGMSHKMTLHFDFKHLKLVQKSILSLKIGAIFHFKNLNSVGKLILKALKWAANLILNLKPFKFLKPYGDPWQRYLS